MTENDRGSEYGDADVEVGDYAKWLKPGFLFRAIALEDAKHIEFKGKCPLGDLLNLFFSLLPELSI
jgi:hypothetical protein